MPVTKICHKLMEVTNNKNSENLHSEARIQQSIVVFYRNSRCLAHHTPRCLIFSVPNENQHRLMATGLTPGCSDLVVIHRNTAKEAPIIAFIECKSAIGRQRPAQAKFQAHVEGMGFSYDIVRSLEEFQALVATWQTPGIPAKPSAK